MKKEQLSFPFNSGVDAESWKTGSPCEEIENRMHRARLWGFRLWDHRGILDTDTLRFNFREYLLEFVFGGVERKIRNNLKLKLVSMTEEELLLKQVWFDEALEILANIEEGKVSVKKGFYA